jgi:hypothetical protein
MKTRLHQLGTLSIMIVALNGCLAGITPGERRITGLDCFLTDEFAPQAFAYSNYCEGLAGAKVTTSQNADATLDAFVRALRAQNIEVLSQHANGVETGAVLRPGSTQNLSFKAWVQDDGSESILWIVALRTSPVTGERERVEVTDRDTRGFLDLRYLVEQTYDTSQIRYVKNVPVFPF